uniref:Uncharacterized protein n=1 Tax=Ciona savignyi TaxID=51511 RepID=H2YLM9_CIOSA
MSNMEIKRNNQTPEDKDEEYGRVALPIPHRHTQPSSVIHRHHPCTGSHSHLEKGEVSPSVVPTPGFVTHPYGEFPTTQIHSPTRTHQPSIPIHGVQAETRSSRRRRHHPTHNPEIRSIQIWLRFHDAPTKSHQL